MFLSEWRDFPSAPCLVGEKELDDSSRLDVVEKARAFLTCFRACFLPSRAKNISTLRYISRLGNKPLSGLLFKEQFDKNLGLAIASNKP